MVGARLSLSIRIHTIAEKSSSQETASRMHASLNHRTIFSCGYLVRNFSTMLIISYL